MVTINCTKQVAPTTERHQLLGLNPCKMSGRCLRRLGKWGPVRGDPLFWDFSAVDIQSFSTKWGAPYLAETSKDPARCTWNDSAGKIQLQKLLPFPFSSKISGSIPIFSWFSQHLFLGISLYLHMLKNCIYGYFFVLRNLLDISKYWHFWHFLMVAYRLDVNVNHRSLFPIITIFFHKRLWISVNYHLQKLRVKHIIKLSNRFVWHIDLWYKKVFCRTCFIDIPWIFYTHLCWWLRRPPLAANRGRSRAERGGSLRGNGVVEALGPLEGAHGNFLRDLGTREWGLRGWEYWRWFMVKIMV